MSISNLLYSPGESRDATDPPLSVFKPRESFDSDSDYTNVEVSTSLRARTFGVPLG